MHRNRIAGLASAAALALPLAAAAELPVVTLNVGVHLIKAEIANTDASRGQGLMYRKTLEDNHGMLFVFPDASRQCMWMKNTVVPLSVAFMDERGVILNIADMAPQTEASHCSTAPARYALEMKQGWFIQKRCKPGTKISGLHKAPPPR